MPIQERRVEEQGKPIRKTLIVVINDAGASGKNECLTLNTQ
jgi:hypothetical protein